MRVRLHSAGFHWLFAILPPGGTNCNKTRYTKPSQRHFTRAYAQIVIKVISKCRCFRAVNRNFRNVIDTLSSHRKRAGMMFLALPLSRDEKEKNDQTSQIQTHRSAASLQTYSRTLGGADCLGDRGRGHGPQLRSLEPLGNHDLHADCSRLKPERCL